MTIRYMHQADAAGGGGEGRGRGPYNAPAEDRGGTLEVRGEGQFPRAVGGRASSSIFFYSATYAKRGGGGKGRRGSAGGKPPDFVEACRAASVSALAPTVAALSLMFRNVLCLLQSGMVCTFLSEGGCGYMAGSVRRYSGTGVLISAK